MKENQSQQNNRTIKTLGDLSHWVSYSLLDNLIADPCAKDNDDNRTARQVFTGHYVPVKPTPIKNPEYVMHSKHFFSELGFEDGLAKSNAFMQLFSGDTDDLPKPMRKKGWACGYALSIFGTEYYHQCPFQTGNGYGDGRAISVLEVIINGKRLEMQLKGGGKTPYCRGADGRAVLRSSIREFLAQEHMHALGVPTSRALSLYVSKTETVKRPWYSKKACLKEPDRLISEAVAIATRVAPSFIRVGQLELFARRARKKEHPQAMQELEQIITHLMDREYANVIDKALTFPEKVLCLAREFRCRLTRLVANWIRVGYCQGNFNSDNCAAGGYTLDYGPFGFCDDFNPGYQSWTGGGDHYAFLNQPRAAAHNYYTFLSALRPLLSSTHHLTELHDIGCGFWGVMQENMRKMWALKLGLSNFHDVLFNELETLMIQTPVDYTLFFRTLSNIPKDIEPLKKCFYRNDHAGHDPRASASQIDPKEIDKRWSNWFEKWKLMIRSASMLDGNVTEKQYYEALSKQMKLVNPKYSLREWFVVPAYQQAAKGNYFLVRELQNVMTQPYEELSKEMEDKYFQLKPFELFNVAGYSFYSCSS